MKKIILVRHAESSLSSFQISDFDRPLSKNGILESNLISSKLKENKISIDYFISSSANRALSTAKIFAENLNFNFQNIVVNDNIYNASISHLIDIIHTIPNNFNEIIVFGHNPSLHKLSQNLTNSIIYEFPTCSAFCIKFDIENWSDLNNGQNEFFLYPSLF